ncbi:SDR family NAD(P)-dependent oxidoreductase [Fodinibius salsisoli]|uniref:SDR family oxidoreductase n=1 Tax=Fodinibius salsisoli TaxID=2820877 RepID=A0ABT3PJP3_9BACT|nr:SDR family oxidoreductase [Fodinibius salsisoli]MCW9706160.1 SDR family oxidoreductase [Fodinibius salsisoli]
MSKTAIVTGASRGIGYEICKKLAEKNHQVIAVARSQEPLNNLAEAYPQFIEAYPTDLTQEDAVSRFIQSVASTYDGIDILINNAGALIAKPFKELSLDDWRSQIESNLISAVNITKQLLSHFNTSAHIVNISSMGGYQGSAKFPGLSAYSVSKGALSILTESLAVELSEQALSVNALCLGAVQTEMLEQAFPGIQAPVSPKEMGAYIADFALTGSTFYNGKVLPVALDDPE